MFPSSRTYTFSSPSRPPGIEPTVTFPSRPTSLRNAGLRSATIPSADGEGTYIGLDRFQLQVKSTKNLAAACPVDGVLGIQRALAGSVHPAGDLLCEACNIAQLASIWSIAKVLASNLHSVWTGEVGGAGKAALIGVASPLYLLILGQAGRLQSTTMPEVHDLRRSNGLIR